MRFLLRGMAGTLISVSLACTPSSNPSPESPAPAPRAASADAPEDSCSWAALPPTPEHWRTEYDGFGKVDFQDGVVLSPGIADRPSVTHAALVTTRALADLRDFAISVTFENRRALRSPAANPWEVFWLFFNYRSDGAGGKSTNYLALKPNGLELGKAWGEVEQEFLWTAPEPTVAFGRNESFVLIKRGTSLTLRKDGKNFALGDQAKLFDQEGSFGLYTEDAEVVIREVKYCRL